MRHIAKLLLAGLLVPLVGCTLSPEQQEWNRAQHVGELMPAPGSPFDMNGSGDQQRAAYQANQDRERQAQIKPGEDSENAAARQAGFGPSPTEGMHCSGTSSFSGSANSGTSTSSTSCHN